MKKMSTNSGGLVLGCMNADFCMEIFMNERLLKISKIFTAFDSQSIPIFRLQRIGLQFAGWTGYRVFRKIDGDAKRAAGPQLTIPAMTWAYAQWFAFCIEAYIAAQASD